MADTSGGDTTVELTFAIGDERTFFVAVSDRLDCSVECLEMIPRRSGGILEYFRVGATSEEVLAAAEAVESVESIRVVSEDESGCVVEAVLAGNCVAETLADYHAIVTAATAENGVGTVHATVPAHADPKRIVEAVLATHPNSELRAKRQRADSEVHRLSAGSGTELLDQLTEKQAEALQTATLSGFLAWPRRSTAQDCAEALGISQPTFSQHLYRGLERLLSQLFTDGAAVGPAQAAQA